jgi:hypothetical protein
LRVGYLVKILGVVVVGVEKMKYEPLGCCKMSQLHREYEVKSRGMDRRG